MPKLSKDSAPNVEDAGPAIDRAGDLDDTTVDFVTIRQSHSLARPDQVRQQDRLAGVGVQGPDLEGDRLPP